MEEASKVMAEGILAYVKSVVSHATQSTNYGNFQSKELEQGVGSCRAGEARRSLPTPPSQEERYAPPHRREETEISLTLPLPSVLSPPKIVLPVKIWHHTFTAHMANQIKRRNVSSLTYENFPGGHPSQYCSHPCTLNSTIPPKASDLAHSGGEMIKLSKEEKDVATAAIHKLSVQHMLDKFEGLRFESCGIEKLLQREEICVQRINLHRGYLYRRIDEDDDVCIKDFEREDDETISIDRKKHRKVKQSTTMEKELIASVDC
ncbi:hypothetical protein F511_25431 [Dorcoceras hygrometricum]|uniref:Uncharacterized protein n=1 Tax=Dorcoceras hygrometricum TaxID=472368 RepID=A0A2Z7BTN1_9LAMI|nr:hypothetical protein F511_25431 [Dorcoceras hygrometricum]